MLGKEAQVEAGGELHDLGLLAQSTGTALGLDKKCHLRGGAEEGRELGICRCVDLGGEPRGSRLHLQKLWPRVV